MQQNNNITDDKKLDNTEKNNNSFKKTKWEKEVMEWLKSFAFALIAALIITKFIFTFTVVKGNSMFPTLHDGDRLVELKIDKLFYKYTRGDIVVIRDKDLTNYDFYVKRIIAVGGDIIKIYEGKIFLNDVLLEEHYLDQTYTEGNIEYYIEEDEVFVIGDNRLPNASRDSRVFGPVKRSSVDGRCVFRIFPLNRLGGLN